MRQELSGTLPSRDAKTRDAHEAALPRSAAEAGLDFLVITTPVPLEPEGRAP